MMPYLMLSFVFGALLSLILGFEFVFTKYGGANGTEDQFQNGMKIMNILCMVVSVLVVASLLVASRCT